MRGYWIFPTLLFISLLYLVLSPQILLGILVICCLVRIYFLRNRLIWFWSFIFAIFALSWGCYSRYVDSQIQLPKTTEVLVNPNDVKVNGDLLQMRGTAGKIPVLMTAKLQSEAEKKGFAQITYWFTVTVYQDYKGIDAPRNEAEFNYQKFEHRQKGCNLRVSLGEFEINKVNENFGQRLLGLKKKFSLYLTTFPRYSQYFLKLLIGQQDDLLGKDRLSRLGLLSLFALSGMQLYFWLSMWQSLGARMRITATKVNIFCLCFLILIIFFNQGNVGLTRSAIFLAVSRLMMILKRRYARLDVWSFTFIAFLVERPFLLESLGGILSFLITFFMQVKKPENRLVTNVKINLLMLPVILQQVFVWNFLSIFLNFLFFPVISFLFPLFCLNLILHFPLFDQGVNFICWILYRILDQLSNLQFFEIVFGQISVTVALMLVLSGLLIFSKKGWSKLALTGLASCYLVLFLYIHFPLTGRVVMFDIGQGDSFLIETPFHKQVILIDTGGKVGLDKEPWQERTSKSRVETVTLNYLHSRGINHLDAVITTHQDADHIGDLPVLIKNMRIDRLIYGEGILQNKNYRKKVEPLKNTAKFIPVLAGQTVKIKGQELKILHPSTPGPGENNDSVTFLTHLGQLTFLFTGDLERDGEKQVLKQFSVQADVLKAGHHGSKTSTSKEFLEAVSPKIAWISAGRNNRYGHPSPETLNKLTQKNIPWLATLDVGMVYYEYNAFKNEMKSFKHGSK
ncbi:DNA internalization-related competence protein ComEC/Rec2 [Xylocopilactobacillus apicola]|uniref:DNA internalization-related competence protein ComEC/Rec2 n=1 Tax=Xylocopilactobacillus apicola TaxID=2932184 RepID=A0AAU9D374_9LACO|nr:DNA internalization-related competence protein ComEC/Rec2 [Xylocopilactobacillus apicola]BDR59271.1 DNA internalization-related competence protein ComEC/Rec2 [Xylocopilactobacillus apicola]